MSLAVTDAARPRRQPGSACGPSTGSSPRSAPTCRPARRRAPRRDRPGPAPRAGERAHPRRHDPVPRVRRRPDAHGLARAAHLARRGAPRRRRRVLGDPAGLPRDDPHRHRAASGTCTGSRPRSPAPSPTPACGPRVGLPLIDGLDPAKSATLRDGARRSLDDLADASLRVTPCLTPARHLHGQHRRPWPGSPTSPRPARPSGAPPLPRDRGRGHRLSRPHRAATRTVRRRARAAHPAHRPRARGLDGGAELEAVAAGGLDRRHEPGVEPQAGRRAGVPVPDDPRAGNPGRARHRRRGVEQRPRPVPGRQGAVAAPEARGRTTRGRCPPTRRGRSPPARSCPRPRLDSPTWSPAPPPTSSSSGATRPSSRPGI